MSSSSHSHHSNGDERWFELVREVYLQGAPVFDVPDWVTERMSPDATRSGIRWRLFYGMTMKEARNHRNKILANSARPAALFLEPLEPFLSHGIRAQPTIDAPDGWDPAEKELEILRALNYVSTGRLTPREQESVHLGCVIPMGRAAAAEVMGIATDELKAHISNAYKKMREDGIDDAPMKWFLTGKLPKSRPPQART
ncbi:hypothetical protein ABT288_37010 [Streptomyces sp. NPDC001093]|uniref:hypothetical protein n=1 Tax=Streptomyces sp. NPDC001093 TaxID=3154376 RepID=UPI0033333368